MSAVHKKLELEAHPIQHVVETETRADRLALRYVVLDRGLTCPICCLQAFEHVHRHRFFEDFRISSTFCDVCCQVLSSCQREVPIVRRSPTKDEDAYFRLDGLRQRLLRVR